MTIKEALEYKSSMKSPESNMSGGISLSLSSMAMD